MSAMTSLGMLVFGPQAPLPPTDYLLTLKIELAINKSLGAIRDTILGLPDLWSDLVRHDEELGHWNSKNPLQELRQWATEEDACLCPTDVPNSISMPLTVLAHLTQYIHYVEAATNGRTHDQILSAIRDGGGVQGFCLGLLSAVAVASASSTAEIVANGAEAVRLAMFIGAYLDIAVAKGSNTASMVVRWTAVDGRKAVDSVLEKHQGAYVSIIGDTHDVTITAQRSALADITAALTSHGMTIRPINLTGACHTSLNVRALERIVTFVDAESPLPLAKDLLVPVRANSTGKLLDKHCSTRVILEDVLCKTADWNTTIKNSITALQSSKRSEIVAFGLIDGIPASVSRQPNLVVTRWKTHHGEASIHRSEQPSSNPSPPGPAPSTHEKTPYHPNAIAIVGMACRFPGADNPEEFWDLLTQGASMHAEVPESRFSSTGLRRSADGKLKFWGNYINDPDSFDCKFFKKSSRESVSMDPQQRLLLEVAYAAVESSGYFVPGGETTAKDIGVYIGACSNDYNDNVASHDPTAFSSLGTLRAFLSGRISHWFDWTGPSLTVDTACSSSAVAIDAACKAIQSGDCSQALAGGVSLYTNPFFYQNLAAASFLSPTGPCKPFDAAADGYCRGEGAGLVVLKKLSDAMNAGNKILGVIASSGVNQNQNCTYITVPHGSSQQILYGKVLKASGIQANDVSYVEAHGTGTPVGDPIEFDSIKQVFAAEPHVRRTALAIGSVKGNIGHLEGAAGIASLIKVCLMIQNKVIPPQANFTKINPKIAASGLTGVTIPSSTSHWTSEFKATCINNYGAAGSNAAMIVCEPPKGEPEIMAYPIRYYPLYLSANSTESLQRMCSAVRNRLQKLHEAAPSRDLTPSMTFALANTQNRSLRYSLVATISDLTTVQKALQSPVSSFIDSQAQKERKSVLCFGGQVNTFVGLSEKLHASCAILRHHLSICDETLRSLGEAGLYPDIFSTDAIEDVAHLHGILYSFQYACAKSWIDCGLKVDALIGHSFGQLTALAVSDAITLQDGLKLATGRAKLIKSFWGNDSGAMLAIEADTICIADVVAACKLQHHTIEVACYNGERSHVLVGSTPAIDVAQAHVSGMKVKCTRLPVTHGFHSALTDSFLPELLRLAKGVTMSEPTIPLETCSEHESWAAPTPELLVEHTRRPVYFANAVSRLQRRLGPITWVEAGTSSSVTAMARRALIDSSSDLFINPQLRGDQACTSLVDATANMWRHGCQVQFWPFHNRQAQCYERLPLPPYQFEKQKHWLDWIDHSLPTTDQEPSPVSLDAPEPELLAFRGYQDQAQNLARFAISPQSKAYKYLVEGHAVLSQPLCPAPLYVELAMRAVHTIDAEIACCAPAIEDLEIHSPLGLDPSRRIGLTLQRVESSKDYTFSFEFASHASESSSKSISHAHGRLTFSRAESKPHNTFQRYERLIGMKRALALFEDPDAEYMKGAMIYKSFSRVVDYGSHYKGVKSIASLDSDAAGRILLPPNSHESLAGNLTNPIAIDNFFQVAGIHVNILSNCPGGEVFVCTKADRMMLRPGSSIAGNTPLLVYTSFSSVGERELVNDIFVFDEDSQKLVFVGLGAHFTRVSIAGLVKVLERSNAKSGAPSATVNTVPSPKSSPPPHDFEVHVSEPPRRMSARPKTDRSALINDVKVLLGKICDIPLGEIGDDATLDDLGIDSLMLMEVQSELQSFFKIEIPNTDWQELETPSLVANYLSRRGTPSDDDLETDSDSSPSTDPEDPSDTPKSGEWINTAATTPYIEMEPSDMFPSECSPTALPTPSVKRDFAMAAFPRSSTTVDTSIDHAPTVNAHAAFEEVHRMYDKYATETGFANFWRDVYPTQARLTLAYTVEAFAQLGCDLDHLSAGETLQSFEYLPQHELLVKQLVAILEDGRLVASGIDGTRRTTRPVDPTPSEDILQGLLTSFPGYAAEHRLLSVTGSKLAQCLTGAADPLRLLFMDKNNKTLLQDVYTNGPMYKAITMLLGEFLTKVLSSSHGASPVKILELGGGTAGTTAHVIERLKRSGVPFHYTFTDLSGGLVAAAKRRFGDERSMTFAILDIEQPTAREHAGRYDVILSTNCIHATRDLTKSTSHIRQMLRPDGFLSVVEFTRNIFWFDLVFGLLDGWWLFEDGRQHVLADEDFWNKSLRNAGFADVGWTDGPSDESRTLRIITGFAGRRPGSADALLKLPSQRQPKVRIETVEWKQEGQSRLLADVYLPAADDRVGTPRPVALLIHGGGHVLFTRKEINQKHVRLLLDRGFLPVSIEHRLCPEVNIIDGAMRDCSDAVEWARETLPKIDLGCLGLKLDTQKVVVVGWSTGGHLALTTAFTTLQRGIEPPHAILGFYCPSDYESDWWQSPVLPQTAVHVPTDDYDLLEGVQNRAISEYYPPVNRKARNLVMSLEDPRWRFVLHMNWKAQFLQVLINGLPTKEAAIANGTSESSYYNMPVPDPEKIAAISPYAQILRGNYKTPTCLVHGTADDLIPWQQSARVIEALQSRGVAAVAEILKDVEHVFDTFSDKGQAETERAYDWLASQCRQ